MTEAVSVEDIVYAWREWRKARDRAYEMGRQLREARAFDSDENLEAESEIYCTALNARDRARERFFKVMNALAGT